LYLERLEDWTLPSSAALSPVLNFAPNDPRAAATVITASSQTAGTLGPNGVDYFRIDLAQPGTPLSSIPSGTLTAQVHAQGFPTSLALFDSSSNQDPASAVAGYPLGLPLAQNDGQSSTSRDDLISQYLDATTGVSTYFLRVQALGGAGPFTLSTRFTPALESADPLPVTGNDPAHPADPVAVATGDFTGDGHQDLATADYSSGMVSVFLGLGDGTFQAEKSFAVGQHPVALVVGDFRGDGILDLATVDQGSNTVSLLLGNGDGTFQPARSFTVGSGPVSLVAADLNGDGTLDLVAADQDSHDLAVLRGNGDGTFQPARHVLLGDSPSSLVAGDFYGDGSVDLAVAESTGFTVLRGARDRTFQPGPSYSLPEGGGPFELAAGDFNGDGHLDLAAANRTKEDITVFLGEGDGTFQLSAPIRTELSPIALATEDFTGDGHLDLAVVSGGGSNPGELAVLVGNGDGTFQVSQVYALSNRPAALSVGDFHENGHPDLAVANDTANSVSIFHGEGEGSFFSGQPNTGAALGDDPRAAVAADFNQDGLLDFATANAGSNDVTVTLGTGSGQFGSGTAFKVGGQPMSLVAGDFNGDGRLDLATANEGSNNVSVLLGLGDGTFAPPMTFPAGDRPVAIVTGDFSGDGHLDLAVADQGSNSVTILRGQGDGTFAVAANYPVGTQPDSLVAGDFTGDGYLDLATADQTAGTVSILLGRGDGTFQPARQFPAGPKPHALVAADFTQDQHLDLAVLNTSGNGTISVLLGNGDGTFQAPEVLGAGQPAIPGTATMLVAGDFTVPGTTDLITASSPTGLLWFTGKGDGTFQAPVPFGGVMNPVAAVAGDFSQTGALGLLFIDQNDRSQFLENQGDGAFLPPTATYTPARSTPLFADFDGHGVLSSVIMNGTGTILFRQGRGDGTFGPPIPVNPDFPVRDMTLLTDAQGPRIAAIDRQAKSLSLFTRQADGTFTRTALGLTTGLLPSQILAGDLTGDGRADLVVLNVGGLNWTLSVFLANADGTFTRLPELPVGVGASDIYLADLDGDGRQDVVVTHHLSGTVTVVRYQGGAFVAGLPFQAGTNLPTLLPPTSFPQAADHAIVRSPSGAFGVATDDFNGDGVAGLVTVEQNANQVTLLPGDGQGGFFSPIPFATGREPTAVRVADFNGDGIPDLAILDQRADGTGQVETFRGDGHGGFTRQAAIAVGREPLLAVGGLVVGVSAPQQYLTVVRDVTDDPARRNLLDLAVGNAFGDILLLLGNGDGTFRPFQPPEPKPVAGKIALAVADLTGKPGETDFIFADPDQNRVTIQYGSQSAQVALSSTAALRKPGAVAIADLNGDGIPDLLIANSGSNDLLVYLGLGNGQFSAQPLAFAVGTDPVGLAVADLTGDGIPDVAVADRGSNDVALLFGQGLGSAWTLIPGPRLKTGAGPVAVTFAHLQGPGALPDLVVTNSLADTISVIPAVGGGFFDDQQPTIYATGSDPQETLAGDFGGLSGLVTVNAGSNDLTVISASAEGSTTATVPSGGLQPEAAVVGDFNQDGTTELLVINNADGVFALLGRGPNGLTLERRFALADVQHPTTLALSDTGAIFVTEAGVASAILVTLPSQTSAPPAPPLPPPALGQVLGLAPGEEVQLVEAVADRLPLVPPGEASEGLAVNSFRGGDDSPSTTPITAPREAPLNRFFLGLEDPGVPGPALPVPRPNPRPASEDDPQASAAPTDLPGVETPGIGGDDAPIPVMPSGKAWLACIGAWEIPQPLPVPPRLALPCPTHKAIPNGALGAPEASRAGIWGAVLLLLGMGSDSWPGCEAVRGTSRGQDPRVRRRR
jgi:hypothetical protein